MNTIKSIIRSTSLIGLLSSLIIGSAYAGSDSCIASGTNTSGPIQADCTIVTTGTTTIKWTAYITGWSGGGGIGVSRSGTAVLNDWVTVNSAKSTTVTGQPAGTYTISQGFGGPPGAVSGTLNCTLSW